MSQEPSKNNAEQKQLEKGNQIITYNREPTTWINIPESEFPAEVTNQNVLQIFEYTQSTDPNFQTDVTIIEENTIKATETSTTSAQTERTFDKYKCTDEIIHPFFLNCSDPKEKTNIEESVSHSEHEEPKLKLNSVSNRSESSVSLVDAATWITPSSSKSFLITDYLKSLAEKTKLNKRADLDLDVAGVHKELKILPRLSKPSIPTIPIPSIPSISIPRLSRPSIAKVENKSPKLSSHKVYIVGNKSSVSDCPDFIENKHIENIIKEGYSKMPDPVEKDSHPTLPPVDCCGKCGQSENVCKPNDSEVRIMCRKGDVKFKLQCRKIEGSVANCGTLGNEVRYECEVIPEKGKCIDKSILESCDLQCSLMSNTITPVTAQNLCDVKEATLAHPISKTDPKEDPPPPGGCPPPPPSTPPLTTPTLLPCDSMPKIKLTIRQSRSNTQVEDKEKNEVKVLDQCSTEKVVFACRSKVSCESKKSETKMADSCESNKSVTKCDMKQPSKTGCKCTTGVVDEITSAMYEAHSKTIATIKCAANDLITNVPKLVEQSKSVCKDPETVEKIRKSTEQIICDVKKSCEGEIPVLKKSADSLLENSCKTIKRIQNCTKNAFKEVKNSGKRMLGYKVDDRDDEQEEKCCNKARSLPKVPKPKNCSYSNSDEGESNLSESIKKSIDNLSELVVKGSQVAKESLTDLTHSIRSLEDEEEIVHNTNNNLDKDEPESTTAFNQMLTMKKSAKDLLNRISSASETFIGKSSDIAEEGKKILGLHEDSPSFKKKIKNIMAKLPDLRKKNDESESLNEEEYQRPGILAALKSSLDSLSFDIPEQSSKYDKPEPPRQVSMTQDSFGTVSGMFASIKDKIYSMFTTQDDTESEEEESPEPNDNAAKNFLF